MCNYLRRLFAISALVFALTILNSPIVYGQQVIVRPSKEILAPEDKCVTLQCVSSGLEENPYNVVVFTVQDRTIYNSSDASQKASEVTVVNHTTIEYFDVKQGVSNIKCRINNTVSQIGKTIPSVDSVSLSHEDYQGPNNSTLIRCAYSIQPNDSDQVLHISLFMNGTEMARFTKVAFTAPTFSIITIVPSLEVTNESSLVYRIQPTDDFGQGKFSCVLKVSVGNTSLTVASPEWNTSSSLALIPSLILLISTLSVLITFNTEKKF